MLPQEPLAGSAHAKGPSRGPFSLGIFGAFASAAVAAQCAEGGRPSTLSGILR